MSGFLKVRAFFRIPFVVNLITYVYGSQKKVQKKKLLPQGFSVYKDRVIKLLEQSAAKMDDDSTGDILWIIHLVKKDFVPSHTLNQEHTKAKKNIVREAPSLP